ncbi:hypothetical protein BACFRA24663_09430 [Bacteroides fragilis]
MNRNRYVIQYEIYSETYSLYLFDNCFNKDKSPPTYFLNAINTNITDLSIITKKEIKNDSIFKDIPYIYAVKIKIIDQDKNQ